MGNTFGGDGSKPGGAHGGAHGGDADSIGRRGLLLGASALAGVAARPRRAAAQAPVQLSMAVWGAKAEQDAYNAAIARFRQRRPEVQVRLEVVPFGQFYQQLDTRLAGRQAPDLFRVQYQQVGRYARDRGAVDLSSHLPPGTGDAFAPALWNATLWEGKPYAVPHHTDTFALFYNEAHLRAAGIELPGSLDRSWTWDEFTRALRALKARGDARYPLAMNWQNSLAYRWMIFLYQNGGRLVGDDLRTPEIASPAGVQTIEWTQSWFRDGFVPPSTSLKSTEPVQNLFATGTVSLMLNGDWQIPFLAEQMRDGWGVTYMPRNAAMASDIGGTCLAVSRDSRNPELAADLLRHLTSEEEMRTYVTDAQFLPVRKALMEGGLDYKLRPDAMRVFVEQARTIPDHLVRTVVMPSWSRVNQRMADELDLAFTSGQAADQTARNIEAHVRQVLRA